MQAITNEQVRDALSNVLDPDLQQDLITLNMVENIQVEGKKVAFTVVLTTPACPMKEQIYNACKNAILHFVDKDAEVDITMTAQVRNQTSQQNNTLSKVKNIIAIASGKGGVGKSTVTANIAVALANLGAKVGIVDADIYGPSIPILFDVENEKPEVKEIDGKSYILPVENYGVKILSIGFFVQDTNQAIVWRGPMASKALQQLFFDAYWGELDYLLIDLPPGTGDIHLSLVSGFGLNGVVIVSTPQKVALADARKGIGMFRMPQINIPILGIIENMSYFTPAELPANKYYIFGKDGAKQLAEELAIPLLGEIPLVQSLRESCDIGRPAALQENTLLAKAFEQVAMKVAQQIVLLPSKKVEPITK